MPQKKQGMTPEQQKTAFRAKLAELIDAGELSLTDADAALSELVSKQARQKSESDQ